MKKILLTFAAVAMSLSFCMATAACGEEEATPPAEIEYVLNETADAYTLTKAANVEGEFVVPEQYEGKPVTAIGRIAFCNCGGLTGITLPASIKQIDEFAFYGCASLENVAFPDGLASIGDFAFYGCYSLTGISIPASVDKIGFEAFAGCYKLVEVWNHSALNTEDPLECGYIGNYAKYVYTADEESKRTFTEDGFIFYEYGEEAYLLGYRDTEESASSDDRNAGETLVLPAHTPGGKDYAVYSFAFGGRTALTAVTIPANILWIGRSAFYDCAGLTEISFSGSAEAWQALKKDALWDYHTANYTVICEDRTIAKESAAE